VRNLKTGFIDTYPFNPKQIQVELAWAPTHGADAAMAKLDA
jgi:hypothetical protein